MQELLNNQKTIIIASLGKDGFPLSSYATYVMKDDKAYVYVSKTATHYENMENNKNVSVMIIEDESNTKVLFARNRVYFKGEATKVSDVSDDIKRKFEEIHTKDMMEQLYKMDFDFFEIKLLEGRLVKGFGKAFDLKYEGDEWKINPIVMENPHNR